jgi:hypothetical protein
MSKRVCAKCGKNKDVEGGLVCEKGHFICHGCSGKAAGIFFDHTLSKCPVCRTKLS